MGWKYDTTDERRLPFGELAILEGVITREQLNTLLARQADRREREERNVKIGTLLVRKGYLSRDEAKALLRLQKEGPIEGYQLLEHLGSGGMGAVFRAIQRSTGREVAVKILNKRAIANDRYRVRFLREAALLQMLEHENLVPGYEQGESNGHLFFAMEYVRGVNGRGLLRREGALPEADLRSYLRQLLAAIAHYWTKQVVHRDIKPENILFTRDKRAKLTDLGLSRQLDDDVHITRPGKTLGTPLYISPELACGRSDIDVRSDLYTLGATFYHLATGIPPFEGRSPAELLKAHVEQPPTPLRELNPRLSAGFEAIILRMMAKRPSQRFTTPEDIVAALDRLERGEAPVVRPRRSRESARRRVTSSSTGSGAHPAWRTARRSRAKPVAAFVAFVFLFALGVLVGSRTQSHASQPEATDSERFAQLLEQDPERAAEQVLAVDAAPLEAGEQVARLEALAARLDPASPRQASVAQALLHARQALSKEALAALIALESRLVDLVANNRLQEAQQALDAYPEAYRTCTVETPDGLSFERLRHELARAAGSES